MERVAGIAPERTLPSFESESLQEWFAESGSRVNPEEANRKVLLFPDTYTNYNYTRPGKAAVRVLESAGVHVEIPDNVAPSGRAAFSVGMLDKADARARDNIDLFTEYIEDGYEIIAVEPSDAVVFQDEYRDLVDTPEAETVAAHAYGISEYMDAYRLVGELPLEKTDETLAYHGHCHQKAIDTDHHAVGVLRRAGYTVDPIDSSCCGMAGSFGYEAEHYDLSKSIAERLFEKFDASDGTPVAPGASCRSQINDRETRNNQPPHPIEKVNELLMAS